VTTNFIPAYREPGLFGPADEGQQETQDAATAERESADLTLRHFTITIPLASIQMTTFFDLDTYEGSSRKMPKLRTLSTPPANQCETRAAFAIASLEFRQRDEVVAPDPRSDSLG
jgi:hypothetical protein